MVRAYGRRAGRLSNSTFDRHLTRRRLFGLGQRHADPQPAWVLPSGSDLNASQVWPAEYRVRHQRRVKHDQESWRRPYPAFLLPDGQVWVDGANVSDLDTKPAYRPRQSGLAGWGLALFMGSAAGAITGNIGSGYGVWAMLMRKIPRSSE